jgi:hypothetical protein
VSFARYVPADPKQRQRERSARMAATMEQVRRQGKPSVSMEGGTTGPAPKSPANRSTNLRRLANGEQCTVKRFDGWCNCQPETTVWAHTNTLSDRKGMGYKGSDAQGYFAGYECHCAIDQGGMDADKAARLVLLAQARTRTRLAELARSKTEKHWKTTAAQWALDRLGARPT